MRVSFLVYGVLYVVIEMIGAALEDVGWGRITGLDVATAITNACLAVTLVLAGLLAVKLGVQRWGGTVRGWWDALGHQPEVVWDDEPIGVRSWRPEPIALPAAAASASPGGTYYTASSASPPFPEDPGPQL